MKRALAAAAVTLSLLGPVAGAHAATRYTVKGEQLTVRNRPSAFVLGSLFRAKAGPGVVATEYFDRIARRGAWVFGRAYGSYGAWGGGGCGWVLLKGLHRTKTKTAATCPKPSTLEDGSLFAAGSYELGCREGCVNPAVVIPCPDSTVYANYNPATGGFANPYGRLAVGRGTFPSRHGASVPRYPGVSSGYSGFGARYLTKDSRAYLIKDTRVRSGPFGSPTWLFIDSRCITRLALVLRADPGGARSLGRFRLDGNYRTSRLADAIRELGAPSSRKRLNRFSCRVHWSTLGLTVRFVVFGTQTGKPCKPSAAQFSGATIGRVPRRGSSLLHTLATDRGLIVGATTASLRRIYPEARRRGSGYVLVASPGGSPVVEATISRGHVRSLVIRTQSVE